jgi:hypothetical protein
MGVLGVAGLLAMAGGASAGQVNFSTGDVSTLNSGSSFHFVGDDGVGVTATATSDGSASTVFQSFDGLGVLSDDTDNPQIDGVGAKEFLLFTFDVPVQLQTARITRVGSIGGDDGGETWLNGSLFVAGLAPGAQAGDSGWGDIQYSSFNPSVTALVGFTTRPGFPNDDFQVGSLSYTVADVTSVPLPSAVVSGLTLMGLLTGGAGLRRLRKCLAA